jgi:hypothetical protein
MQKIVKILCDSDAYDIREVADYSMKVGELISRLQEFPADTPVALSFDNGYLFGIVNYSDFRLVDVEGTKEEKEKERKEQEECYKECEWYNHISDKLQEKFGDEIWLGEEETCDVLTELVGKKCDCYDHYIDDYTEENDEVDKYTVKACFRFENSPIIVRIYYGQYSERIGYVDVDW